ncbi:MAG TPA: hypothetical protein VGL81_28095 [Polyangiaceae bacterium]
MKRLLVGALAIAMSTPSLARAQETSACEARVHVLAGTLDRDARRAHVWYWAWMTAGLALIGGQATLAAVTTGNTQKDFIAGAATSVFIPSVLLLQPPAVLADAPLLDARIDATTVDGRLGDPCIVLPRARELLLRDAHDQAFATGWFAHAFVIGGNIAVGLLLGLAFKDWSGAAKQAIGGSAVGELQILTLPTGALTARGLGLAGTF